MRIQAFAFHWEKALLLPLLLGCSGDPAMAESEDSDPSVSVADGEPGPGAYVADFKTSEEFFTRLSTPVPSPIHANVRIWYSSNIEELDPAGPFTVPEGTLAIKSEYDDDGNEFAIVVMIKKQAGFDPDHGDWHYEAREPDGSLSSNPTPGAVPLCIDCHQDGAATDYLLGFALEN